MGSCPIITLPEVKKKKKDTVLCCFLSYEIQAELLYTIEKK